MTDWHGIERRYRSGDRTATRLRELVSAETSLSWLDRDGVLAAWGERNDPTRTIATGVRREVFEPARSARFLEPDGRAAAARTLRDRRIDGLIVIGSNGSRTGAHVLAQEHGIEVRARGQGGEWTQAFETAVARIARRASSPVVAIGGGLDGAAVLAAWRASGVAMPVVVTAVTGLDGYDEVDDATVVAARYGCRCELIDVTPEAIVRAIPEAAAVAETPLYNLHPVARLVLAREVASRGLNVLVTGDGGDAVFAGVPDHDYVPIVAAYTRAYLAHASPYIDDAVIAATPIDPTRRVLRDYVGDERPKRARMMPAIALDAVTDRSRIDRLARVIDLQPAVDVRWVTLDHAVRSLER